MYVVRYSNGGVLLSEALGLEPWQLRRCRDEIEWLLRQEYPEK